MGVVTFILELFVLAEIIILLEFSFYIYANACFFLGCDCTGNLQLLTEIFVICRSSTVARITRSSLAQLGCERVLISRRKSRNISNERERYRCFGSRDISRSISSLCWRDPLGTPRIIAERLVNVFHRNLDIYLVKNTHGWFESLFKITI